MIHTHELSQQEAIAQLPGAESLTVSFYYYDRTNDYPDFVPGKTYYERTGPEEYDFTPTPDGEMQAGKIYFDRIEEAPKTYRGYTDFYIIQRSTVGNHPDELLIGLQKPEED